MNKFQPNTILESLGSQSPISAESDYNSEQLKSAKGDIAWEDIEQEYESEIEELAVVTSSVYFHSKQPPEEDSVTENGYAKTEKKNDRTDDNEIDNGSEYNLEPEVQKSEWLVNNKEKHMEFVEQIIQNSHNVATIKSDKVDINDASITKDSLAIQHLSGYTKNSIPNSTLKIKKSNSYIRNSHEDNGSQQAVNSRSSTKESHEVDSGNDGNQNYKFYEDIITLNGSEENVETVGNPSSVEDSKLEDMDKFLSDNDQEVKSTESKGENKETTETTFSDFSTSTIHGTERKQINKEDKKLLISKSNSHEMSIELFSSESKEKLTDSNTAVTVPQKSNKEGNDVKGKKTLKGVSGLEDLSSVELTEAAENDNINQNPSTHNNDIDSTSQLFSDIKTPPNTNTIQETTSSNELEIETQKTQSSKNTINENLYISEIESKEAINSLERTGALEENSIQSKEIAATKEVNTVRTIESNEITTEANKTANKSSDENEDSSQSHEIKDSKVSVNEEGEDYMNMYEDVTSSAESVVFYESSSNYDYPTSDDNVYQDLGQGTNVYIENSVLSDYESSSSSDYPTTNENVHQGASQGKTDFALYESSSNSDFYTSDDYVYQAAGQGKTDFADTVGLIESSSISDYPSSDDNLYQNTGQRRTNLATTNVHNENPPQPDYESSSKNNYPTSDYNFYQAADQGKTDSFESSSNSDYPASVVYFYQATGQETTDFAETIDFFQSTSIPDYPSSDDNVYLVASQGTTFLDQGVAFYESSSVSDYPTDDNVNLGESQGTTNLENGVAFYESSSISDFPTDDNLYQNTGQRRTNLATTNVHNENPPQPDYESSSKNNYPTSDYNFYQAADQGKTDSFESSSNSDYPASVVYFYQATGQETTDFAETIDFFQSTSIPDYPSSDDNVYLVASQGTTFLDQGVAFYESSSVSDYPTDDNVNLGESQGTTNLENGVAFYESSSISDFPTDDNFYQGSDYDAKGSVKLVETTKSQEINSVGTTEYTERIITELEEISKNYDKFLEPGQNETNFLTTINSHQLDDTAKVSSKEISKAQGRSNVRKTDDTETYTTRKEHYNHSIPDDNVFTGTDQSKSEIASSRTDNETTILKANSTNFESNHEATVISEETEEDSKSSGRTESTQSFSTEIETLNKNHLTRGVALKGNLSGTVISSKNGNTTSTAKTNHTAPDNHKSDLQSMADKIEPKVASQFSNRGNDSKEVQDVEETTLDIGTDHVNDYSEEYKKDSNTEQDENMSRFEEENEEYSDIVVENKLKDDIKKSLKKQNNNKVITRDEEDDSSSFANREAIIAAGGAIFNSADVEIKKKDLISYEENHNGLDYANDYEEEDESDFADNYKEDSMIESEYDYPKSDMSVSDVRNDDIFNENNNTNSDSEYVESKSIENNVFENEEQSEIITQNNNEDEENEDLGLQFIIGKIILISKNAVFVKNNKPAKSSMQKMKTLYNSMLCSVE